MGIESSDESWQDEVPADEVTVHALDELVMKYKTQRDRCDQLKEVLKSESVNLEGIEKSVMAILGQIGRAYFDSPFGRIAIRQKKYWSLPRTVEERQAFFNYLKEKGQFESLVSVNSQTLQGYMGDLLREAELDGKLVEFEKPPGLSDPFIRETISFTGKKK